MSVKSYSDINKDVKDLLVVDYPSKDLKLTVSSNTEGLTTKAIIDIKEPSARIENKYEVNPKTEITGKFATSKDFSGSLVVKGLINDSKLEACINQSDKKGPSAEAAFTLSKEKLIAKVSLKTPFDNNKLGELGFESSFLFSTSFQLGGNLSYQLSDGLLKGEGIVAYSGDKFNLSAKGNYTTQNQRASASFSTFTKLSDVLKLAFNVDMKPDLFFAGVVGGEYKVSDEITTKTKLQANQEKKETDYRVGFSIKHKRNNVTGIISTDLNVPSLLGVSNNSLQHSFGAELKLDL